MSVCRLNASEAAVLAGIDAVCFSLPWSEASFYKALGGVGYAFFGYREEGILLGYAGMLAVLDEADVTNVAVLPEYRRRGIARRLVEALIEEARGRGITRLHLEVRESNTAARTLYESLGFVTDGRRKGYYRQPTEDAVLMTLVIL